MKTRRQALAAAITSTPMAKPVFTKRAKSVWIQAAEEASGHRSVQETPNSSCSKEQSTFCTLLLMVVKGKIKGRLQRRNGKYK